MKYKLIINSLPLLSELTGIGKYTYEVSKSIAQKTYFECNFFYGYFSKKLVEINSKKNVKLLKSYFVQNKHLKSVVRKVLFSCSGIFSKKYDLYWEPNFIPLKSIKANKIVVSVHDFSWELYPEFQPKERVDYFKQNFYLQIKKADLVITGSEFTKQEIVNRIDIEDEKIQVIYHGINHDIFYRKDCISVVQQYILAVGSLEPRKNLKNLLLAYEMFDENIKSKYNLILVGAKGWKNDEILQIIERLNRWVSYSGYVSDDKLVELYNQATVFIYPSFYEGFGIPPLEAMACGTPVICSDSSSLPEVGGDAVLYCNPYDIEDIKEKIALVLDDEDLQEKMIKKGLERAKIFSWNRSAEKHFKIFQEVLEP